MSERPLKTPVRESLGSYPVRRGGQYTEEGEWCWVVLSTEVNKEGPRGVFEGRFLTKRRAEEGAIRIEVPNLCPPSAFTGQRWLVVSLADTLAVFPRAPLFDRVAQALNELLGILGHERSLANARLVEAEMELAEAVRERDRAQRKLQLYEFAGKT